MSGFDRKTNIQYAVLQSLFWMSACAANSFAVVYLQAKGLTNSVIGIVLSGTNVLSYFVSNFMSEKIDQQNNVTVFSLLPLTLLVQFISLICLFFLQDAVSVTIAFGLFMTALLTRNPLIIQLGVHIQYAGIKLNYSACRGMGSVAYVLSSVAMGYLVAGSSAEMISRITVVFVVLQCIADYALYKSLGGVLLKPGGHAPASPTMMLFIKNNPSFSLFVLGLMFIFIGHCTVNNFLINVIRYLGGNEKTLGNITGLTAAFEIPIMLYASRIMKRLDMPASTALKISLAAFIAKHLLIALSSSIAMYCAAVSMQGISYAVLISVGVSYAKEVTAREDAAKAQALFSNVSLIGAALSGIIGGRLYDLLGVFRTLIISAVFVAAGASLSLCMTQKTPAPSAEAENL